MAVVITPEHPASPDATALIAELDADLEPVYPRESRHGFSVPKLIADSVAFFAIRDGRAAVGCGGIKLFGTEYGEIKRMWVRPPYRGSGFGKLIRTGGLSAYSALWPVHRRPGQSVLRKAHPVIRASRTFPGPFRFS
jgi:putative acetyltransferase